MVGLLSLGLGSGVSLRRLTNSCSSSPATRQWEHNVGTVTTCCLLWHVQPPACGVLYIKIGLCVCDVLYRRWDLQVPQKVKNILPPKCVVKDAKEGAWGPQSSPLYFIPVICQVGERGEGRIKSCQSLNVAACEKYGKCEIGEMFLKRKLDVCDKRVKIERRAEGTIKKILSQWPNCSSGLPSPRGQLPEAVDE